MTPATNRQQTIITVDTTLRDGEQAAGVYFTRDDKLRIAEALSDAGVSILDAGFPVVSREEQISFKAVARAGLAARIFATVRADIGEITQAGELGAQGIFLFFPISRILSGLIRSMTVDQFRQIIIDAVNHAFKLNLEVMVVLEDAGRAGSGAEDETITRLHDIGVNSFIIAESVGALTPWQMQKKIHSLTTTFPTVDFGIHCHDDYGLATANSLAAIEAGALYFSGTINSIGERAGNASLEEVAVATENLLGLNIDIDTRQLLSLCKMVEEISGFVIPPIKPVSGLNTFKCESGLHTRALLRQKGSYEPFPPEQVGQSRSFSLGKHTGMEYLDFLLEQKQLSLAPETKKKLLIMIKGFQEKNKPTDIYDFIVDYRKFYAGHAGISNEIFESMLAEVCHGPNSD
jgi:isopropylmalate/homocitrate/citramalate synthase